VYGDGSQAYDFVSVLDCARANVAAMKAETTDEFYNVCTGNRTSILELAQILLELTSSDLDIDFIPEGQTFVKNRIGAPDKAREQLEFKAEDDLRAGLQNLIEWRQNHIHRTQGGVS
jgi:UDP-glucose 4-epimerase